MPKLRYDISSAKFSRIYMGVNVVLKDIKYDKTYGATDVCMNIGMCSMSTRSEE